MSIFETQKSGRLIIIVPGPNGEIIDVRPSIKTMMEEEANRFSGTHIFNNEHKLAPTQDRAVNNQPPTTPITSTEQNQIPPQTKTN